LKNLGAFARIPQAQVKFISPIFSVPKKNGKERVILNLVGLNKHLCAPRFRMESLADILGAITPKCYMVSIDLSEAYFSIPIHPDHRGYLAFLWGNETWAYQCMPFGAKCAPRAFTKLLRPMLAHLRQYGIDIFAYLDDLFLKDQRADNLVEKAGLTLNQLQALGFVPNYEKSSLTPSQRIQHLGVVIDSCLMRVYAPEEKLAKVASEASRMLSRGTPTFRKVAKLVGTIESLRTTIR